MGTRKLPDHIAGTSREWKQRKRAEWKLVMQAMEEFRMGCAFTPAYIVTDELGWKHSLWDEFEKMSKVITKELSCNKWGR